MKGERMNEELYAFYKGLKTNYSNNEYAFICFFNKVLNEHPDYTIDYFYNLILEFNKKIFEESRGN